MYAYRRGQYYIPDPIKFGKELKEAFLLEYEIKDVFQNIEALKLWLKIDSIQRKLGICNKIIKSVNGV